MQIEGAPAGAFPKPPPGAGLAREAAQDRRFPVLPAPAPKKNKQKKRMGDCIGVFAIGSTILCLSIRSYQLPHKAKARAAYHLPPLPPP